MCTVGVKASVNVKLPEDGQSLNLHAKSCYRIPCHKPDSRKRSDAEGKVTQLIPRFTPVAMGKFREKD